MDLNELAARKEFLHYILCLDIVLDKSSRYTVNQNLIEDERLAAQMRLDDDMITEPKVNAMMKVLEPNGLIYSSHRRMFVPMLLDMYESALNGHHYVNWDADFSSQTIKGSYSNIYRTLVGLDKEIGTRHSESLNRVLSRVKPFRFLDLPLDIRMIVYELLLLQQSAIPFQTIPSRPGSSAERFNRLSILRVCKRTHLEASPIYYGQNTFLMHFEPRTSSAYSKEMTVLRLMGAENRSLIKKLEWGIGLKLFEIRKHDSIATSRDEEATRADTMRAGREISTLLQNVQSVVFYFEGLFWRMAQDRAKEYDDCDVIDWINEFITEYLAVAPTGAQYYWDMSGQRPFVVEATLKALEGKFEYKQAFSTSSAKFSSFKRPTR